MGTMESVIGDRQVGSSLLPIRGLKRLRKATVDRSSAYYITGKFKMVAHE